MNKTIGKKFNKLTVLRKYGHHNDRPLWLCQCECGNFSVENKRSLNSKKDCGCSRWMNVGDRQGKLSCISGPFCLLKNKNNSKYAMFKCDCGNEVIRYITDVKKGKLSSCGCSIKLSEVGDKHNLLTLRKINVASGVFECECGTIKELKIGDVVSGNTKSCGCYRRTKKQNRKFQPSVNRHNYKKCHALYQIWIRRKALMCKEWSNYDNFYNDMIDKYHPYIVIKLIDESKPYSRDNWK
jgi:hypothetical protein